GSERPKRFSKLHASIQDRLHVGVSGIGDDAAMTECARPNFTSALKPSQDLAPDQRTDDAVEQRTLAEFRGLDARIAAERVFDLCGRVSPADRCRAKARSLRGSLASESSVCTPVRAT